MNLPKTGWRLLDGRWGFQQPRPDRRPLQSSPFRHLSQREALATHARRQRIHQVDDVAGIARFHGRSYRLALALLGSAARRVRFRSGLQICPL
jgi:hypothetical protein